MNDDEVAQMMLEECLYNAGIIDKSPFHDEEEEKEEWKLVWLAQADLDSALLC